MKKLFFFFLFLNVSLSAKAQFPPQAGNPGSDAIPASSPQIVGWATECRIERGYIDIAQPGLGKAFSGDSSMAVGPADNFVVSLGDSGVATLSFATPIINGPGPDFGVFENGFVNPGNPELAFLELAFVEVSSDGVNFFRFPAASHTPLNPQIPGAGEFMDARRINNLAGKYIGNYGTPFDLQELEGTPGLDVNNIVKIRIVDVVGSVAGNSSLDAQNQVINDPYPTPFPTGGFDLDAVAVLHQKAGTNTTDVSKGHVKTWPNPAETYILIEAEEPVTVLLSDISGKVLKQFKTERSVSLDIRRYSSGIYFLSFINEAGQKWVTRISKR